MKRMLLSMGVVLSMLSPFGVFATNKNALVVYEETDSTKAVHLTLITTRGLTQNSHSDIFQNVVVAESLFNP